MSKGLGRQWEWCPQMVKDHMKFAIQTKGEIAVERVYSFIHLEDKNYINICCTTALKVLH